MYASKSRAERLSSERSMFPRHAERHTRSFVTDIQIRNPVYWFGKPDCATSGALPFFPSLDIIGACRRSA
jgi:hypothetical protein